MSTRAWCPRRGTHGRSASPRHPSWRPRAPTGWLRPLAPGSTPSFPRRSSKPFLVQPRAHRQGGARAPHFRRAVRAREDGGRRARPAAEPLSTHPARLRGVRARPRGHEQRGRARPPRGARTRAPLAPRPHEMAAAPQDGSRGGGPGGADKAPRPPPLGVQHVRIVGPPAASRARQHRSTFVRVRSLGSPTRPVPRIFFVCFKLQG